MTQVTALAELQRTTRQFVARSNNAAGKDSAALQHPLSASLLQPPLSIYAHHKGVTYGRELLPYTPCGVLLLMSCPRPTAPSRWPSRHPQPQTPCSASLPFGPTAWELPVLLAQNRFSTRLYRTRCLIGLLHPAPGAAVTAKSSRGRRRGSVCVARSGCHACTQGDTYTSAIQVMDTCTGVDTDTGSLLNCTSFVHARKQESAKAPTPTRVD